MKYSFKSCKMLIQFYPLYLVEQIIKTLISILTPLIPIYVSGQIVTLFMKDEKLTSIVMMTLIAFGIYFLCEFIIYLFSFYEGYVQRMFCARLSTVFYRKLSCIDYDFHESPVFLNDYTRSLEEGVNHIYSTANYTFTLIISFFQSLSIFTILFQMHYLTVLFAFVLGSIYLLIRIQMGRINHKSRSLQRPYRRHTWYSNRAFTLKDGMADLKTSEIDEILLENNDIAHDKIIEVLDKYTSKVALLNFIGEILMMLIYPGVLAILAYLTIEGVDLPEFTVLATAATTLSSLIVRISTNYGQLQDVIVECRVPFDLMNTQGKIEGVTLKNVPGNFESLEVKDMTFSYDGKKNCLEHINMEIKKGQKIAIVGSNGAGKTTLVKLLLRLYDPNSGSISINHQNYQETTAKDIRIFVGAVFQNVETYAMSIAENVLLRAPKTQEDIDLVIEALKFAGLYESVEMLPQGIHTQVTREFDQKGIIFSGGQNQKLAIARGYAQHYELFILDEPSSALDPIAEAKVYQNMLELGKDRTIIFISHRLTTTVNADKIYLFEQGKIIEEGTHQEMMDKNGIYKKMFLSQSSKYLGKSYE